MTLTYSWHELPNVQCDLGQHVIWAAFLSPEKLAGETGKEKWRVKYHGRLSPLMLVMLTLIMKVDVGIAEVGEVDEVAAFANANVEVPG